MAMSVALRTEGPAAAARAVVVPAGAVEGGRSPPPRNHVSLAEVLAVRPSGLSDMEAWALLCQATQALQDLFLSGEYLQSLTHTPFPSTKKASGLLE